MYGQRSTGRSAVMQLIFDVMDELAALLAEVRQTREDKALVLTGAGDVFLFGW
ncbi:hypothetical protein GCM10020331_045360 [Ectobacillus funiculus]